MWFRFLLAAFFVPALANAQDLSGLKINEIQSGRGFTDLVEIYNTGDAAIELVPMVLKDHLSGEANEFTFCMGHIEPHGFWQVQCPRFLNRNGERLGLYDENGNLIDMVTFPPSNIFDSFGRIPDGEDDWCYQASTPGEPNRLEEGPPAMVGEIRYAPPAPQIGETVTVTFTVVSALVIDKVDVVYGNPSGTLHLTEMAYDDGLHGDGEAGDGVYGASLNPPVSRQFLFEYGVRFYSGGNLVHLFRGCFFHYGYVPPAIRINEVLTRNRSTGSWEPGSVGPFADYVELFNAGSTRVNVSQLLFRETYIGEGGIFMSNNGEGPMWIDPGDHLLVWATRERWGLAPVGLDLSLSHNGENLLLVAPDKVSIIDAVSIPHLEPDTAYGRVPDGTGAFRVLDAPTPQGGDVYPPGVTAFIGCSLAAPTPGDSLPLRAWVSPDLDYPDVRVRYRVDGQEKTIFLHNDGLHNDDLAGDAIFGGTIPPYGRVGELQFAIVTRDFGGKEFRDPWFDSDWYSIPVGLEPLGRLVINEICATRFDEGGVCPEVWNPQINPDDPQSKFVEIYNNGRTLEDVHFVITGSMFNWSRGMEFKRGHIAQLGSVKAFPWEELGGSGGTLFLRGVETGTLYDAVTYPPIPPGSSYGRTPDGGPWELIEIPTPGKLNGPFYFIRSDANGDGLVDISDAINILFVLFLSEKTDCRDSLDANDDGLSDLADVIYLLSHLFTAGPQPRAPFPGQGEDETEDELGCNRVPHIGEL